MTGDLSNSLGTPGIPGNPGNPGIPGIPGTSGTSGVLGTNSLGTPRTSGTPGDIEQSIEQIVNRITSLLIELGALGAVTAKVNKELQLHTQPALPRPARAPDQAQATPIAHYR